jgi:2-methylcitrate dehydratase PrpD
MGQESDGLELVTAPPITRELAAYAAGARFDDLPASVRTEAPRALLNWLGCALGGCHEPAVEAALAATDETAGPPRATILGHNRRMDVANAAFVNCLSSSALAFDDTHLATVTHPTGPVAAGALAFAETAMIPGEQFLTALAIGIEIQCRLSNMLLLAPAKANLGLYITGVTGPIGAAAALGLLRGFDTERMNWALGLAAAQGAGFRATHRSMAGLVVPALAARNGVAAAQLAAHGFTCSDGTLEAENGFASAFAAGADPARATACLGRDFEMLANAYKPYPCGIVIHPTIDACLDLAPRIPTGEAPAHVAIVAHPLAITLTDRPAPRTPIEAQVSLQYWAAVSLLRGKAGLDEIGQDAIDDAAVISLRNKISVTGDLSFGRAEATVEVRLATGATLRAHVTHARGSTERPMTDEELDRKFLAQTTRVLPGAAAERLIVLCRDAANLSDIGREIATLAATV